VSACSAASTSYVEADILELDAEVLGDDLAAKAGAFALPFIQPVFAQAKCDDVTMMKMQADMAAMDDSMKIQKDKAMKEMDIAKEAMKADKSDDCMMYMDNAMKVMMNKG
jgi:hypothetical protein